MLELPRFTHTAGKSAPHRHRRTSLIFPMQLDRTRDEENVQHGRRPTVENENAGPHKTLRSAKTRKIRSRGMGAALKPREPTTAK